MDKYIVFKRRYIQLGKKCTVMALLFFPFIIMDYFIETYLPCSLFTRIALILYFIYFVYLNIKFAYIRCPRCNNAFFSKYLIRWPTHSCVWCGLSLQEIN
jgi:hypothetical protein